MADLEGRQEVERDMAALDNKNQAELEQLLKYMQEQ